MKQWIWKFGMALLCVGAAAFASEDPTGPADPTDPTNPGDGTEFVDEGDKHWDNLAVSWQTPMIVDIAREIVVDAPVVRGCPTAKIVGRDVHDGTTLWEHHVDFPARFVSWLLFQDKVVALFVDINTYENVVLALDVETGQFLWQQRSSLQPAGSVPPPVDP